MDRNRTVVRTAVGMFLFSVAACSGSEATAGRFEVTDSAGLVLVRNPGEVDWTDRSPPTLVEDVRIGSVDGPPETQFGRITGLDIDVEGNIYVLDRQTSNVRVFDTLGTYLFTMGREGQGPGELDGGSAVVVATNGIVWVVDGYPLPTRLVAFSSMGEPMSTFPLPLDVRAMPREWRAGPQGSLLVKTASASEDAPELLLRKDPGAGVVDTVYQFMPEPAAPTLEWAALEDGRVVIGRTDEHRFLFLQPDGTVERVVTRAARLREMTDAHKEQSINARRTPEDRELQRERLREVEFHPAYTSLMAGPNNTLWTRRHLLQEDVDEAGGSRTLFNVWDVYDEEGRLLGAVQLPGLFTPVRAQGQYLYGTDVGSMREPQVVRLRWTDGT